MSRILQWSILMGAVALVTGAPPQSPQTSNPTSSVVDQASVTARSGRVRGRRIGNVEWQMLNVELTELE